MATVTTAPPIADAPSGHAWGVPYRLSSSEYFRMVESGIIPPGRRVGLWEGQLYEKMAKKLAHAGASSKLAAALFRALPAGWCVWLENPILVDDFSAPLPDAAVIRGQPDDYTRRGSVPRADEIALVIEIADSSLRQDRGETLRTYARAGLPIYWVVNLVSGRVEVYSGPVVEGESARYQKIETFQPGSDLPLRLGGAEAARIPARDLLPEAPG